jgi:adenosylhomocysteine nucleosidase
LTAAVGVVAAMTAEARVLGALRPHSSGLYTLADGTLVSISGIGFDAASAAANALVEAGATALVSWGLAGGLDPQLRAGAIVLPVRVLCLDATAFPTSADWRNRVAARLMPGCVAVDGAVLSAPAAVDAADRKAELFQRTGAVAVDMESAAIARVASERHLPFIAVRVIVDTAGDSVPRAVVAASTAGEVNLARLIGGLLRAPSQIPPLIRLAQRYAAAKRSLRGIAGALQRCEPVPA